MVSTKAIAHTQNMNHHTLLMRLACGPAGELTDCPPEVHPAIAASNEPSMATSRCVLERSLTVAAPRGAAHVSEIVPAACNTCCHCAKAQHLCALVRSASARKPRSPIPADRESCRGTRACRWDVPL